MKRNNTIAGVLNLFVGILSYGAWLTMAVLTIENGVLTSNGFSSLKYFTVLSNLFNGAVSLFYGTRLLMRGEITRPLKTLKLVSTTAVGLTFLTVVAFLGPLYGYRSMFQGSNFWMHLVLPVTSILSFLFPERGHTISFRDSLWSMLPTLLYEIGYLGNIGLHGIGEWPASNDFYGFLLWGYPIGALFAVTILLTSWGIALLLRLLGGCRRQA